MNKDNILNQLMDQLVMNLHLLELPHQLKMKKTQAVLDSSKSKETKKFPMMNQYNWVINVSLLAFWEG